MNNILIITFVLILERSTVIIAGNGDIQVTEASIQIYNILPNADVLEAAVWLIYIWSITVGLMTYSLALWIGDKANRIKWIGFVISLVICVLSLVLWIAVFVKTDISSTVIKSIFGIWITILVLLIALFIIWLCVKSESLRIAIMGISVIWICIPGLSSGILWKSWCSPETDYFAKAITWLFSIWAISVVVVVMAVVVVLLLLLLPLLILYTAIQALIKKVRKLLRKKPHEELSLLEKTSILKDHLTSLYKRTCDNIEPLPNQSKIYRIDKLFVEGGIEVLTTNNRGNEVWKELNSHHDILRSNGTICKRIILEGESGFGKTILCHKMAYDWYTRSPQSPYGGFDIFILLNVRLLGSGISLCSAIKRHLLPHDTTLTVEDISEILASSKSSLIVFDGLHQFIYQNNTDLHNIFMNNAFQTSHVILTTRPNVLPKQYFTTTSRMKLVGFNNAAQDKYMCNVVSPNDPEGQRRVKTYFEENPALFVFCHIPLFFALWSHLIFLGKISAENGSEKKVTNIFQSVIQTSYGANQNHQSYYDKHNNKSNEDYKLQRLAFEWLRSHRYDFVCKTEKLQKELGHTLSEKYERIGLLTKNEVHHYKRKVYIFSKTSSYITKYIFSHSIFCEWYAAMYLSLIANDMKERDLAMVLRDIHPLDHPYLYRFACGLNKKAAVNIVKYLECNDDCKMFAQLCIAEKDGGSTEVLVMLKQMFNFPVIIEKKDNLLHQRSIMELFNIASDQRIDIAVLWLQEMNPTFNRNRESLMLSSGVNLPKLETLQELSITESSRKFLEEDVLGLLSYASLCTGLSCLRLHGCLLPRHLTPLQNGNISVVWIHPTALGNRRYVLNTETGDWEMNGEAMSTEEYRRVENIIGLSERCDNIVNESIHEEDMLIV